MSMVLSRLLLVFTAFLTLGCTPSDETEGVDREREGVTPTVIYFTRHAEKADGEDPELLPAGSARAQRIASKIGEQLAAVYATGFRRTQATAAPAAQRAGVSVRDYSSGGNAKDLIKRWLKNHRGETILVVGHSNTVPDFLNALIGRRKYRNIDDGRYDLLYRVTVPEHGKPRVEELSSN